jgi:hypothetical protein
LPAIVGTIYNIKANEFSIKKKIQFFRYFVLAGEVHDTPAKVQSGITAERCRENSDCGD